MMTSPQYMQQAPVQIMAAPQHATSECPDYGSPADDGSASTCADYGSPAIHSTSTNTCTNQHDDRCFSRNQHDQRWFFRNSESACLVTQERDNASCKVPR